MELGIDIPVSVSMKDDERNSLFRKIVSTAENPHMSVPETESGRRSKNIRQVVNSSLLFVSGSSFFFFHRYTNRISSPPKKIVMI